MAAGEVLIDKIGVGTSNAVTSSARVLPDAFSALINASLGVVSHRSIKWQCAIHSACATQACSDG